MHLQALSVLMSVSLFLLTGVQSASAQASTQGAFPVSTPNSESSRKVIPQVLFKPSGTGNPPPTRGAGSRNDRACLQDSSENLSDLSARPQPLTALVPGNQVGLTWAERPTFWVYLPETSARQMVLSVKGESTGQHSQRFLPITGEAGIVGIQFDQNAAPLKVGKSYQWAVVLVCGDRPSPNDPFVTAWIQRVAPAQASNNQQSAVERAAWYGEKGAWYDALTVLAEVWRSQPNDSTLAKIWADFLAQPSVGLGAIANEPVW
ncbi:DUF928 domain-containing protein [Trichocoleus sp. FACHB-591]|uniref:DUF928 domain-containing protein n=1 Tax=Trichocoleus sp. FACHB-591 TaxID=2692872 RepID=UPI0018EF5DBE|nr:DUF928 domain-containing protein [Trichocoleus sp. FACHB-591]